MPRFAANLTMLYAEHPFAARFEAAAADGFDAVECLFPYEHAPAQLAGWLRAAGLTQALLNLPPGDWAAGERGLAALPGRERDFARALDRALEYAHATGCRRLHVMAGLVPEAARGADASARATRSAMRTVYVDNLGAACAGRPGLGPKGAGRLR